MITFGERYVVDTNALIQLRKFRRSSAFFKRNVVIPAEVLREAEKFSDYGSLRDLVPPVTARTFAWLGKVLSSVDPEDFKLVDLYANKGGADPFVVACALEGREIEDQYIDPSEWIVVTDDSAVRQKAVEFDLKVISNLELAGIIDRSEGLSE